MPRSLAGFFLDEIFTWRDALIFHSEEIEELEELLKETIRLNTVPNIAANAEHHLAELNIISQILHTLKHQGELLQKDLRQDQTPLPNHQVTEKLKLNQAELRTNMLKGEKDFLDARYRCNAFIAESLCAQQLRKNH